jgi:hypothetical protein
MAKRLTDTTKWNDSWFTELPMDMKLVWIYILDTCDHAGVYKVNLKLLKFQTGTEKTDTEIIEYLKERIYIKSDKWFIPKFIMFQYKNFFTSKTPAIISAKELLISHNIIQRDDNVLPIINKELNNPSITLIEGLNNDYIRTKDKDKSIDINKNIDKDKMKAVYNAPDIPVIEDTDIDYMIDETDIELTRPMLERVIDKFLAIDSRFKLQSVMSEIDEDYGGFDNLIEMYLPNDTSAQMKWKGQLQQYKNGIYAN